VGQRCCFSARSTQPDTDLAMEFFRTMKKALKYIMIFMVSQSRECDRSPIVEVTTVGLNLGFEFDRQ
jgi:hypothetical protein